MNNSKAKIIAVANQKGGVAKTTSVINIGAGLALKGKNVLLVDTDNQSHLSRFLGYDGTDGKPTISELIWQTVSKVQKLSVSLSLVLTISRLTLCLPELSLFSERTATAQVFSADFSLTVLSTNMTISSLTVPRHLTCSFQMLLKPVTRCLSLFSLTFELMRVSIRYLPHFKEQSRQAI